jgi:hypothetical protein
MTDADRKAVEELHGAILDAWNRQDADAIFADHQVASYVRIVRRVREIGDGAALLHAVVGMVPPGGDDLIPDRNAVQLLLAVRTKEDWRAVAFQNTPARLGGRPKALEALTDELRAARDSG